MLPLVQEIEFGNDVWNLFRKTTHLPYPLLLESVTNQASTGNYSYLFADPLLVVRAHYNDIEIWHKTTDEYVLHEKSRGNPFHRLSDLVDQYSRQFKVADTTTPCPCGFAGLFGYGLGMMLEDIPMPRHNEFDMPDMVLGLYDRVVIHDHRNDHTIVQSTGLDIYGDVGPDLASQRLGELLDLLAKSPQDDNDAISSLDPEITPELLFPVENHPTIFSSFTKDEYLNSIRRAIEYIHAGDCFQVNIAQRLVTPQRHSPIQLYDRLRQSNPAPFACYFDIGNFQILSASPERFLSVNDRRVETRPIKGTISRLSEPDLDQLAQKALKNSEKDRAENVMIVDLLRNDLGRVCQYGSIKVKEVCQLETYQFVHHLVSIVEGRLATEKSLVDLLRAAFPGGSITGAPKVRAMEIISELEQFARGAYCGSVGFLGLNGSMDTNILIRTMTVGKGWIQFPVGGGIVADSHPEKEYAETLAKARGALEALCR